MRKGRVVWITGLPSAGKSTLAVSLNERLRAAGTACCLLDGDAVRDALVPRPGYDEVSRDHFYETLARLAALLASQGLLVLVAATAHQRAYRDRARALAGRFLEVWVDVPLEECRSRDAKGLYAAQTEGRLSTLPGGAAAYEPPLDPDVVAHGGADADALAELTVLLAERA
jgi:adenylylsulfate kinase